MRSTLLISLCLALTVIAKAQYTVTTSSPSFIASRLPGFSQVSVYNTKTIAYTPSITPTPITPVDGDSTHEFDQVNNYGDELTTSISTSDGNVTTTSVGKVWTLRIYVTNALNIGFTFTPLSMPSNAEMYIFNGSQTLLMDSITKAAFKDTSNVSTPPISGDTLIIYIVERGNTGVLKSVIHINQVIAGFVPIQVLGSSELPPSKMQTGPTTLSTFHPLASLGCDPSIQCQPVKLPEGLAVAEYVTNGDGCTGTLINNESINGRSYFLTAFHCIDKNNNGSIEASETAALKAATFLFKFWKNGCTGNSVSYNVYTGATVAATSRYQDGILLELTQGPGIGDGPTYAGWNTTDFPNNSGPYILHHPLEQDMRITNTSSVNNWVWNSNFYTAHYSSGTTDKGSSGAALFNQSDEIVGQLRSGWSNCTWTDFGDRYGKFGVSFNNYQAVLSPGHLTLMDGLVTSTMAIAGPSTISCGNSVQYSIPNLYQCTFLWTVGTNLSITAGQNTSTVTVTVSASNTSSSVTVLIVDTKGIVKKLTLTKTVTLSTGGPAAATITSVSVAPYPNNQIDVHSTVPNGDNATSYKIYVDNAVVKSGTGLPPGTNTVNGGGCGNHTVYIQLINYCGPTNSNSFPYTRPGCSMVAFNLSPNPATTVLNVQAASQTLNIAPVTDGQSNTSRVASSASTTENMLSVTSTDKAINISTLEIYNSLGQLRLKKGILLTHSNTSIDISSLSPGTYWVKISLGSDTETHGLIIVNR